MLCLEHAAINIGTKQALVSQLQIYLSSCPIKRGVSAASFDATGLGERTAMSAEHKHDDYSDIHNFGKFI